MRVFRFTICLGVIVVMAVGFGLANPALAQTRTTWSLYNQNTLDSDGDGLSDWKEINLYQTNPYKADTDGDGIGDGAELMSGHDPNVYGDLAALPKHIYVSLEKQELRYYTGRYLMDDFSVSTGIPGRDTPSGEFSVLAKVPVVLYEGADYYFPDTKWNLRFLPGFYIHGAFWHSNFGNKMSHGCVNVSYADVLPLYNWADVGTPVTILAGDFPANLFMALPSNTLIKDGQTIYLIMGGKKYGFTNMAAFTGLGYNLQNVQKRSSAGIAQGGVLDGGASMPHPDGSWVLYGQTVYYVSAAGLVPVPTWEIFLANGGQASYIVPANDNDLAKPLLGLMAGTDMRVMGQ